jgi:hypothetical protein
VSRATPANAVARVRVEEVMCGRIPNVAVRSSGPGSRPTGAYRAGYGASSTRWSGFGIGPIRRGGQ